MKKIKTFFRGVRKEAKTVRWSDGKTLVKYSCITLILLAGTGLFFYGLDALFAFVRGLF